MGCDIPRGGGTGGSDGPAGRESGALLGSGAFDGGAGWPDAAPPPQTFALTVTEIDKTFVTREHFIASLEMQLSGEPLAQAMRRSLGAYNRDYHCQANVCSPSTYYDPSVTDGGPNARTDLAGFSSAVESYEYSKQPMNNIAFESGAGTSLLFGPVLNPSGARGAAALALAQAWVKRIAGASNAFGRFVRPPDTSTNPLGWPGLWLTLQPFTSWDPSITPTNNASCSISSDDNPGKKGALTSDDYECDYSTLHLPNRATQVSMTIGPGASGWAGWKEALWTLNYLQVMHDVKEATVSRVPSKQVTAVGHPGNVVVGNILPGVYLGSSDIEGFQAGNFIQILDNQAAQWLLQLTTADGTSLGGFANLADALAYSPASPLRWFPRAIAVAERPDASGFPAPASYAITSSATDLLDLAGLLGAYSSAYALTDQANANVGGSQPVVACFDGDPFPVQNQTARGEPTLHDRALAMMRVLVVNMDRMLLDPATGLLVDYATVSRGKVSRGTVLSTDVAAYTLLSLRTARRALDSELTLYGNTKPDTHGIPSPLDGWPPLNGTKFGTRLDQLIARLSAAFYDHFTLADGTATAGFDVATLTASDSGASLDAHTAAIRGLLLAYLATGATRYRDRATQVFRRLERVFYDPAARVYRATSGDRSTKVTFTPRRFGLLQGALRETYELVASLPGQTLAPLIEQRIARLNKLVLNGWDDRDEDESIEWPSECAHLGVGPDGRPLGLGGLQMAERVLTGESGSVTSAFDATTRVIATDREHDCVPEISAAKLPSALASSVTFTLAPWSPAQEGLVPGDAGWATP